MDGARSGLLEHWLIEYNRSWEHFYVVLNSHDCQCVSLAHVQLTLFLNVPSQKHVVQQNVCLQSDFFRKLLWVHLHEALCTCMEHLFDSSVAHHLIQRLLTEHELVPAQEVFLSIECVHELDEFALLQKFDGVV